jgi:hypothetical protein
MCYQAAMPEPSRQTSRRVIAAGALAAIALAGGGFVLGRATTEKVRAPTVEPKPPIAQLPTAPPPTLPGDRAPLARAALLAGVAAAADAFAAGSPVPDSVTQLAGRRFETRLPFGCRGAATDPTGALSWSYNPEQQTLRLRAVPVQWASAEWLPEQIEGDAVVVEAVEGFWVTRPWTASELCPPIVPDGQQAAPEQTAGIAQFFTETSSRVGRRDGKSFEAVEKIAPDALDAGQGFRWVLSGRIAPAPDGRLILCRSTNSQARPTCLVSVRLDRVAFEGAQGGATIAEWDVSGQREGVASGGAPDPSR